jgi:hypothetical protein
MIWKLAKKISSMACENFWQKPKNVFFWNDFKVKFLEALFDRSLPFFQHILFMESLKVHKREIF